MTTKEFFLCLKEKIGNFKFSSNWSKYYRKNIGKVHINFKLTETNLLLGVKNKVINVFSKKERIKNEKK